MGKQRINVQIAAREQFREFLASTKRWSVLVAHRRAGKTVAVVQKLIMCALTHKRPGPPLRFAYIAPTRDQAKDIAWAYVKDFCKKIPGTEINESELRATLPNQATIRLYSGENYERMRGLYFDGVVSDEDADIPPQAFDYVILPCLLDYNGWHIRIGTPKGRNAFYRAYNAALADPDSYALMLKASQSGILSAESLKAIQDRTTPDSYAQEMECDFSVGRPGAIYAKDIQRAREEGRVGKFPVADTLVHTSWDVGAPQNTSVWYWQAVGAEIRMIDCDVGVMDETLTARWARMMAKGYRYGYHILPHDAAQTGRNGRTLLQELAAVGLTNMRDLRRTPDIWLGINALRGLMPSLCFRLPHCEKGLDALESYHTEEVEPGKRLKTEPVHDWSSHTADAIRYMAEAIGRGIIKTGVGIRDAAITGAGYAVHGNYQITTPQEYSPYAGSNWQRT